MTVVPFLVGEASGIALSATAEKSKMAQIRLRTGTNLRASRSTFIAATSRQSCFRGLDDLHASGTLTRRLDPYPRHCLRSPRPVAKVGKPLAKRAFSLALGKSRPIPQAYHKRLRHGRFPPLHIATRCSTVLGSIGSRRRSVSNEASQGTVPNGAPDVPTFHASGLVAARSGRRSPANRCRIVP